MRIAIVDDLPEESTRLRAMLEQAFLDTHTDIHVLDLFPSAEALLAVWQPNRYDLVLLDIYMGGMTGVEAAHILRDADEDVRLVFCTTSSYYLHKPYSAADIRRMVTRVRPKNYELTRYILLPDGQKVILRDIVYTEYENHIISIHRKRGGVLQTRMSQGALEALVATDTYLVSCAKGLLVNLYEAQKLEGDSIYMTGGICLPVSRRRSKDMQKLYEDHLFRRMREEML